MTYYLDTSALAKRYLREPGTEAVRSLFRGHKRLVVSRIAYAELAAALARAWRAGMLDLAAFDAILGRIEIDFAALEVLEIRPTTMRRVPSLVRRSPLRGYDAVQLASALTLHDRGASVDFWSADGALVEAARTEGLRATLVV